MARAFAREGAGVFLAGRTLATLDEVAEEIRSAGGVAETAQVDALDEKAVDEHADAVAAQAGGIDISFNLITHPSVHGTPLAEMELEDFTLPVMTAISTTFLTSRAAARHMIGQGSGVILVFGGSGPPCATTTSEAPRSHSRRLSPCGASWPPSSVATACGS